MVAVQMACDTSHPINFSQIPNSGVVIEVDAGVFSRITELPALTFPVFQFLWH